MTILREVALAALLSCCLGAHSLAEATPPAEIRLAQGINTVKLGNLSLRIVKATVGTGTASDFDTYTVFLVPANAGDAWMHVTAPAPKGLGYNFRSYETGDANTQAVAFYRDGTELFAVQASKIGAPADAAGARTTQFDLETFSFNGDEEIPMFTSAGKRRSTGRYVDAAEALQRELFRQEAPAPGAAR